MINELRFAFRTLVKRPAFTLVAVTTLAVAIGATTAVVSLLNAVLIRPLPYRAPDQLVLLWQQFPAQGLERMPVSAPEYVDYERRMTSFQNIAAVTYSAFNLTTGDAAERVQGAIVSPALFPLLGIEPVRGRVFTPEEFGEGHDDVVVISARLWKRRFDSDPRLVGSAISLNGQSVTVIGIMPEQFEFPLPLFNIQGSQFARPADIWKPIAFSKAEMEARYFRRYWVIARLRSGISLARAQSELDTITASFKREHPDNYRDSSPFGARLFALQDLVVGGMRTPLWITLAAVTLVLLIACANLAMMLLAAATAREREIAIRVALGASFRRLLQQLLTESVLLSLIGGTAGVLVATSLIRLLRIYGAQTIPRLSEVNIDARVLLISVAVSIGTGILFGLAPALASSKLELTESLKEGGRSSTSGLRRNRFGNTLVIIETALALVLLLTGGLLMKSFVRLQSTDPGFNPSHVLTGEVSLPRVIYPPGKPLVKFYAEADRRIRSLPGVQHAAFAVLLPLSGSNTDNSFIIEGQDSNLAGSFPDEEIRGITADYFRVLQVPLLKGRFFNDADGADSPGVVIVNDAFARKYFGNGEALGKRISLDEDHPNWMTIVGVVGNIRHRGLDIEPKPEFYLPHAQWPDRDMVLAIRTSQDPRTLTPSVRSELRRLDADIPLSNVRTLEEVMRDSVAPRRLSVVLIGAFAAVALLLASVGMYGLISFLVVQRTHEIGVRMALGAGRADILQMVIWQAGKLLLLGAAIGLPAAFLSTWSMRTFLYQVHPFDIPIWLGVVLTLAVVVLLASYIPAVRATRADPMIALSHDA
jgi:putative ABC transport system permease protein